jgi:nicotinamidase-related amidase
MSNRNAFLVIDTQVNMFNEELTVFQGDRILETIAALLDRARAQDATVIYLRNDGGPGEPDERGTYGWEIHPTVAPTVNEVIIDKTSPDGFENTTLKEELEKRGIEKLVIVGMQTELCVFVTSRRATRLGYEVIVVEDGHTTFDSDEMTASETIDKYNAELDADAIVMKAADIEFS